MYKDNYRCMVDISPYISRIQKTRIYEQSDNPRGDFLDYLSEHGFTPPAALRDGVIDRIKDEHDKGTKRTGWYIYNQYDDIAVGVFGTWRDPDNKTTWTSKDTHALSFAERVHLNDIIKQNEAKRREEERLRHDEAALEASEEFLSLEDVKDNPYLIKKNVKPCDGLRQKGEVLYMPILDGSTIVSYQKIYPDGTKRMKTGGRKKGCYFVIEGENSVIYISEGLSTGLSVHDATGNTVYVAIDCGNLYEVSQVVIKKYPSSHVVLAGENNEANINKCEQIDLPAIFPPDKAHDDFNDMHVALGLEAVTEVLKPKIEKKKKEKIKDDLPQFNGALQDIINYYNATSGNKQPLFAIQSAMAACSVILARNFTTNFENRTSLFMLNLAKSGTGKEHAKKTIEKILEATDNADLIGGDGYTSASAVISGLQMRPRHIAIIDEFSKNIEAANNKNSGSHLKEANAKLMEAFGRLDGTIRARSYSTIGLTDAKKKELSEQKVINPAITLLCMSTPDDFFEHMGARAIKDGFINRFLVCISEAEREIRQYRGALDVPQSIIDWNFKIKERTGQKEDIATDPPDVQEVPFTLECMDVQKAFEQKCIDLANKLEEFQIEDIAMRANEMSMRIALIVALSENPNADFITPDHCRTAIAWVEYNLMRMIDNLKMSVSGSQFEADKKTVLKALRDREVTRSDMHKRAPYSRFKKHDLDEILNALYEAGLATTQEIPTKGRSKIVWTAM